MTQAQEIKTLEARIRIIELKMQYGQWLHLDSELTELKRRLESIKNQ